MSDARPMNDPMTWTTRAIASLAAALMTLAVVAVVAPPGGADEPDPPAIHVEPLTDRHEFTDDVRGQIRKNADGRPNRVANLQDASNLAVMKITIEAGAMFPWHTHPGPVLVAVVEGEAGEAFTFVYADDCVRRDYDTGEAFVDLGRDVHMAYNPSETHDTVVIATFLDAPASGPLTIPVDGGLGGELDDRCGIDRPGAVSHEH